ncbi:Plasminogen activator inhibitor 1 RNA-binding protein [Cricetulus griseus]|uniref:Plasminogen activator inhibitor 1 RNA-binding protein n=1 Tax=Cricetulus griseus TaxID=10029 RepID=G3I683_CRIGR|nr:Plasminogen activator inhibitor 1 RNA-binding protein [Cricetulus griseus]
MARTLEERPGLGVSTWAAIVNLEGQWYYLSFIMQARYDYCSMTDSVSQPIIERPIRGRGGLGRGRGGRGRGMGRGDGFDSRGKREFDRHSGSDRSESPKYIQKQISYNCSDLDQSNVTEETPEGEEHPVADTENKENEVEEVKEEGPKEMTLDEWKAIQNKDRAKVEFNIRKPNEGADGQWKKGFVLHKSKSEESSASAPDVDDPEAFPALA